MTDEENKKDDEMIEVMQKKAQLFLETNRTAFIRTKQDNIYNGNILWVGADFIIINDDRTGDTPIFYMEITKLMPSLRKKEEDNGKQ